MARHYGYVKGISSPANVGRRQVVLLACATLLAVVVWLPTVQGKSASVVVPAGVAPVLAVPSAMPVVEVPTVEVPVQTLVVPYRIQLMSTDHAVTDALDVIPRVLGDPRGWQQAGIEFRHDPTAAFTIVVAEGEDAQQLCQPYDVGGQFSCQNGPVVVLNAIRWRQAVPHWPGDLASYRAMLINHEVGHLLGMHHLRCAGPGAVAPVMEQQSGSLRGCQPNPWPTPIEVRLAATHQFTLAPPPTPAPGTL